MNNSTELNCSHADRQTTNLQTEPSVDFEKMAEIAFHTFIFVGGLVGNLFVVWVILRRKRMRTPTNWLVFNLAISDLVIVLYVIPLTNVLFFVPWPFGKIGCKYLFMPTSEFPAGVSVLTHTAMALLRYYIVCRPLGSKIQVRTVVLIIVFIWIIAFLTMSVTIMGPLAFGDYSPQGCALKFKSATHKKAYRLLVFSLTYIIPMVATGFAYRKIHTALRDNFKNIRSLISKAAIHCRARQGRKLDRTLMMMYVFFACTTLPIQLLFMSHDFELLRLSKSLGRHLFILLLALFYTQVVTNPFVLFYMGDEFRKELYALPMCCFAPVGARRLKSWSFSNFDGRELSEISRSTRLSRLSFRYSRRWSRISSLSVKRRHSSRGMHTQNDAPENKDEPIKSPTNNCYIPLSYFTTTCPESLPSNNVIDASLRPNENGSHFVVRDDIHEASCHSYSPRKPPCIEDVSSCNIGPPLSVTEDSRSLNLRRSVYGDSSEKTGISDLNFLSPTGGDSNFASSHIYERTEVGSGSTSGDAVRSEEILDSRDCVLRNCPSLPHTKEYSVKTLQKVVTIKNGELLIEGITRETLI